MARPALNLYNNPMPGMSAKLLGETGEPLTQPPSRTHTPAPTPLVMTTDTIATLMTSQDPPQMPYFDQEERADPDSDKEMPPHRSYDAIAFSSNMARGSYPPCKVPSDLRCDMHGVNAKWRERVEYERQQGCSSWRELSCLSPKARCQEQGFPLKCKAG